MEQPVHLSHHRLLDWQQLVKLVGFSHLQTTVSLKGECTLHSRVFLKRHFVKNQNLHPTTQQGDTQGEHIQKERLNKQV